MSRRGIGILAAVVSLGAFVAAPTRTRADDKAKDKAGSSEMRTIRGVLAGVTVEGETVVDSKTNRAATAEMSYLTIVGSPHGAVESSTYKDEKGQPRMRRRHNIYVLAVTRKTEIRDGSHGDKPTPLAFDALEVGEHVEATFKHDQAAKTASRGHGRHRTYFGELTSITVLTEPAHHADQKGKD